MFTNIAHVIEYGTTADAAMSGDEGEVDPQLAEGYAILWQKFPGFREYLLKLTNHPLERRSIERYLNTGIEAVRSEDGNTLKFRMPKIVQKDKNTPLDPPLLDAKLKIHRGRAHPVFARLLMPIYWEAENVTIQEILEGEKQVTGKQLPRFIFPLDQVFPVGADVKDPVWLDVLDNALTGEVCLRSAKTIFMGPESAFECDGYHKGRAGKASIIGMTTFTKRTVCWVVTQVHFALSSKQEWHKMDGDFDYEDFYWTIYGLFEDEVFGQRIINLWNKVVLGKVQPRAAAAPEPAGPSHLEELLALRAARNLAAATDPPADRSVGAESANSSSTPVIVPAGAPAS
ncbi:hypothetical protein B0H19DRAFT_1143419 [Mycena capillaripes]|nr:hypothetical protein B0H19DRAFT_1143419 [Mycena capillaripes]